MRGSADAAAEGWAGRARPLSGGLWTLFSWLRRDERSSSSDSLSSAGSDRTAVSFAFLASPPPSDRAEPPPPLGPPTDSYRKRVHDGNLRRQYDRDLTLHRKYGLYYGYDAFSLPPARKYLAEVENERDRERRANSESFPRRSAHVPGKRRAPLPPSRPHSVISTASLTRRHIRKRPAPQPPAKFIEKSKENIEKSGFQKIDIRAQMHSNSLHDRRPLSNVTTNECSSEKKNSLKDTCTKETKIQKEKSFLKQIFESKKRNTSFESVPERILPSISELDKQAAEIIKSCKLTPIEQNNNSANDFSTKEEAWFCTRCLRKYDSTIVTCQFCLPEQKRLSTLNTNRENVASSTIKDNNSTQTEKERIEKNMNRVSGIGADEKQKLKEMLKEMKDSLPKKSKQTDNDKVKNKAVFTFDATISNTSLETPTLRVESKGKKEENKPSEPQSSTSKQASGNNSTNITEIKSIEKLLPKIQSKPVSENVVITQHVVLIAPQQKGNLKLDVTKNTSSIEPTLKVNPSVENKNVLKDIVAAKPISEIENGNLNTPLKISSLLNPVYIPKNNALEDQSPRNLFFSQNTALTSNINSFTPNSAQRGASTVLSKASSDSKSNLKTTISEITKPKTSTTVEPKSVIGKKSPKPVLQLNKKVTTEENSKLKQTIPALPSTSANDINTSSDKTKLLHSNMTKFTVDQHSRRRDLIDQLEQSIAKGDERAAAEAAVKLAQLRLSCSVLSFSSQIMDQTIGVIQGTPNAENKIEIAQLETAENTAPTKVNAAVQSSAATSSNASIKNKVDARKDVPVAQTEKKSTEAQTNRTTQLQHKLPQEIDGIKPLLTAPLTSKQTSNENGSNLTTIQVWVEDREATRGPVRLRIPRQAVMGDLRRQAETSLGLVDALQRWIVGRTLCTDDRTPLVSLAGPDLSAPFYLCVVETENSAPASSKIRIVSNKFPDQTSRDKTSNVYSELVQLEQQALVVNTEPFECGICMDECADGDGAVLRECVHTFCRGCMTNLVKHCEEPIVGCPAMGCPGVLQEREIRALVTPEEYERWLARGLAAAESGTRNAFHCRTRDCTGWALCDPDVRRFPCPVCKHTNCILCQALHEGETCEQYRKKLQEIAASSPTSSQTDEGTRVLLDTLITKGEALECPECKAIITKKWGCDWVKCSACKTEICWVTRGRRWGPGGKGDTSGGCRCGIDGKRCHPSCGYCH